MHHIPASDFDAFLPVGFTVAWDVMLYLIMECRVGFTVILMRFYFFFNSEPSLSQLLR
jgi:hypothetical protein